MNRLTEYIKSQRIVRERLTLAEVTLGRKELATSLHHTLMAFRAMLVAQNNVVSIAYKKKPAQPRKVSVRPVQPRAEVA